MFGISAANYQAMTGTSTSSETTQAKKLAALFGGFIEYRETLQADGTHYHGYDVTMGTFIVQKMTVAQSIVAGDSLPAVSFAPVKLQGMEGLPDGKHEVMFTAIGTIAIREQAAAAGHDANNPLGTLFVVSENTADQTLEFTFSSRTKLSIPKAQFDTCVEIYEL